jgi:hypothetical protein
LVRAVQEEPAALVAQVAWAGLPAGAQAAARAVVAAR